MRDHTMLGLPLLLLGCVEPSQKNQIPIGETSDLLSPASEEHLSRWSSEALETAHDYWEQLGSTALVVVHEGYVIAEWGDVTTPIQCHSVRKSFLSALYGAPVADGTIRLDATLAELGIDDSVAPSLSDAEKQATVEQLLMSRSGVYHPAAYETESMEANRPERESHDPGTHWYYNNWDFNALGTIFHNETGRTVFEAFYEDIAIPTGMQHFTLENTEFVYESDISDHPAYTFQLSARDRARFGQLFLDDGQWGNERLIGNDWIERSTTSYSDAGSGVGYGYMWWIAVDGWHLGSRFEERPYSARGYGGQYIVVVPERDLVIVQSVNLGGGDEMHPDFRFQDLFALLLEAEIR